jgi:predicted metal-dependent RNase
MNVLKNGDVWYTNTAKLYKVSITTDKDDVVVLNTKNKHALHQLRRVEIWSVHICKTSGDISKRLSVVIPLVLQNLEENSSIESSIGKDINFPTVVKKNRNDVVGAIDCSCEGLWFFLDALIS